MPDSKPQDMNGAKPKLPDMTPQERALWLASHNAPDNMLLFTQAEVAQILGGAQKGQRATAILQRQMQEIAFAVGRHYFESEPTLIDSVASAAFDAERYKKAVDLALPKLRSLKERLDKLIASTSHSIHVVVQADLLDLSQALGAEIKALEKKDALRRERRPDSAKADK